VVVVPRVAEEDDAGLGGDLLPPLVPERLEGVAIVGVAVDPDDVSLGVDPVHCFGDVLDAFEERRDFVDAIDEHEGSHLGEL
jgi:hypothetical protein